MYVEIERAMAKVTSVTPIMEKHGKKKKRPAHSIIFEFSMSNTILDRMDDHGLRNAFYCARESASVDKRGQTQIDTSSVSDGVSKLRFPWWSQWIDVPGELVGWVITLHTGNTERSHIVLDEAKVSSFQVLPKDLAVTLVKCKVIVHPTAHEKGKIDELLQTDVPVSIMPPETMQQGDMIGHTPLGDEAPEGDDEQPGDDEPGNAASAGTSSNDTQQSESSADAAATTADAKQSSAASGDAPIEDPFAGSDLARGKVNSDAKVTTKKSRKGAPADKHADGAWPFPSNPQGAHQQSK